jgi:hypothetical protein
MQKYAVYSALQTVWTVGKRALVGYRGNLVMGP